MSLHPCGPSPFSLCETTADLGLGNGHCASGGVQTLVWRRRTPGPRPTPEGPGGGTVGAGPPRPRRSSVYLPHLVASGVPFRKCTDRFDLEEGAGWDTIFCSHVRPVPAFEVGDPTLTAHFRSFTFTDDLFLGARPSVSVSRRNSFWGR